MSSVNTRVCLLLLICLCASVAGSARAFSDPELFLQPAVRGGGGGRFFTGSPADGQACSVCHRGGVSPVVGVSGLPEQFDIGAQYEVTVHWAHPEVSHGLQLELLTETNVSPPLELPPPAQLASGARCESSVEGDPAVYITESEGRRIVGVRDCGASEVTFRFVAPNAQRMAFAASIVRSDSSGTSAGDGATDLRRVIYARGQEPASGGCNVAGAQRSGGLVLVFFGFALALATRAWRRRARMASISLAAALSVLGCYQPEHAADYTPESVTRSDGAVLKDLDAATNLLMDAQLSPGLDAAVDAPDARSARSTQLTFRVLTSPLGGRYAPRNIGAIWIEREDGSFVKSLARWAQTRAMYLRRFEAAYAGDLTDAITSATLDVHQLHEVRWDLTARGGVPIANGRYRLVLELTDKDSRGVALELPFELSDGPLLVEPPATPQFKDMRLELR